MPTTADRLVALLEWGDVAEADAAISAGDGWHPVLWRGMRALMEGRFHACERAAVEALERGAGIGAQLLLVSLRRDQERLAEAENLLLAAGAGAGAGAGGSGGSGGVPALHALLLAEMGRDGAARQELDRELGRLLDGDGAVLAPGRLAGPALAAHAAAAIEAGGDEERLATLARRLRPHASDCAVEEGGVVFYGSVSYALGRLAQAQGRAREAIGRFADAVAAHQRVGAPLWLAHCQRHLAALLRTEGGDGDWDHALELLRSAATIYRRLAVDGLAAATQLVLARMEATGASPLGPDPVFRAQGDCWLVGAGAAPACLRDAPGLHDVARLLAARGKPVHVTDLLAADRGQPWLDGRARADCAARLGELAAEAAEAEAGGDAVRAALARAERDSIAALAGGDGGDIFDRARRAVATRIRISLDQVERLEPAVGSHLRASIRTGTFCSYEPLEVVRWDL